MECNHLITICLQRDITQNWLVLSRLVAKSTAINELVVPVLIYSCLPLEA